MTVESQLWKISYSGVPRCPSLLATLMFPHKPRSPVSFPLEFPATGEGHGSGGSAHTRYEQTGELRGGDTVG